MSGGAGLWGALKKANVGRMDISIYVTRDLRWLKLRYLVPSLVLITLPPVLTAVLSRIYFFGYTWKGFDVLFLLSILLYGSAIVIDVLWTSKEDALVQLVGPSAMELPVTRIALATDDHMPEKCHSS